MVALNFNATNVKPNAALEAIPSGMYPVMIVRSEEKPTKAGDGSYIEFEMQVQASPHVDPAYHGRKVFDRLNINNKNQTAVDIAYATLSAICHVTGVLQMQDTSQLHGRPFVVVVTKKERDDQPGSGNMSNEVKGYKDMNGNDPGFAGTTSSEAAKPQWAGNGAAQSQQPAPVVQQEQAPAVQQQVEQQPQVQQQAPAPTPAPAGAVPSWAQKK